MVMISVNMNIMRVSQIFLFYFLWPLHGIKRLFFSCYESVSKKLRTALRTRKNSHTFRFCFWLSEPQSLLLLRRTWCHWNGTNHSWIYQSQHGIWFDPLSKSMNFIWNDSNKLNCSCSQRVNQIYTHPYLLPISILMLLRKTKFNLNENWA